MPIDTTAIAGIRSRMLIAAGQSLLEAVDEYIIPRAQHLRMGRQMLATILRGRP